MILCDDIYDWKFSLKTDFTFVNVFLFFFQFFKILFCLFKKCLFLNFYFSDFKNDLKKYIFFKSMLYYFFWNVFCF